MLRQTKLLNKITFIYTLFSLLFFSILISCGDNQESGKTIPVTAKPESFTFFELGTNTQLTEQIRQQLGDKLGNEAIERRGILNLNTIYEGFIEKNLPQINELNRKINFPPGERFEHNTVKLMYRYPRTRRRRHPPGFAPTPHCGCRRLQPRTQPVVRAGCGQMHFACVDACAHQCDPDRFRGVFFTHVTIAFRILRA